MTTRSAESAPQRVRGSKLPVGLLAMLVLVGLLVVATRFSWAPVFDEAEHHRVLHLFSGVPGLEAIRTYGTSNGPLFYWLYANATAIVDFAYPLLRFITVAFGLLCLIVLARFELDLALPKRRLSLMLLASPYFFTLSMLFMSDVMGLLGVLVAALLLVRAVAREPTRSYLELGGAAIALGLVEYVRQYYMVVAASLVAFALFQLLARRRSIQYAAVGIAAGLFFLPLFLLWHGLVSGCPLIAGRPWLAFGSYENLVDLNLAITWTGLYVAPIALAYLHREVRRRARLLLAVVIALTPLVVVAFPVAMGRDRLIGLYSSAMILAHVPDGAKLVIVYLSWAAGISTAALVILLLREHHRPAQVLLALMMASQVLAVVVMTGRSTERYFLAVPAMAAVFFAFDGEDPLGSWWGRAAIGAQLLIAVVYFVAKITGAV